MSNQWVVTVVGGLIVYGVLFIAGNLQGWASQVSGAQVLGVCVGLVILAVTLLIVRKWPLEQVVEGNRFYHLVQEFGIGWFLLLFVGFGLLPALVSSLPVGLLTSSQLSEFDFIVGVSVATVVTVGVFLLGMFLFAFYLRGKFSTKEV
jgi:uncharacterized membrane protein